MGAESEAKKEKTGAGRNKEKRKRRGEKGGEAGLLNANVDFDVDDLAQETKRPKITDGNEENNATRDTDTRSQMAICSRYHSDVSDQPKKQTSEAKALKKELQMAEEYAVYLSDLQNHPQYTNNLKDMKWKTRFEEFLRNMASMEPTFWTTSLGEERVVLTLPEGCYWLGIKQFGNEIYVRQCYDDIAAQIVTFSQLKGVVNPGAIIEGTPGVGKSMMLGYLLYYFRCKHVDKNEFFIRVPSEKYMLHLYFYGGKKAPWKCHVSTADKDTEGIDGTVCLFDTDSSDHFGLNAHYSECFVIASCSPSIPTSSEHKRGFERWCMPVWSFSDLSLCYNLMLDGVQTEYSLEELYDMWGGSARYCIALGTCRKRYHDGEMKAALRKCRLVNGCPEIAATTAEDIGLANGIIHIAATQDYRRGQNFFASEHVRMQLLKESSVAEFCKALALASASST